MRYVISATIVIGVFACAILHAPTGIDSVARWIALLVACGTLATRPLPKTQREQDSLETLRFDHANDLDDSGLRDSLKLVSNDSNLSFVDYSDSAVGLKVRLIDLNAWSVPTIEKIVERVQRGSSLKEGLTRCVHENLITSLQAEFIGSGQECNLRVGHYLLHAVLGQGAMGIVYLARDLVRGEDVALKLFRNTRHNLLMIRREMTVIEELAHPNIVTAYEVGASGHRHFIAMELVEGQTWRELILRDGKQDELTALNFTTQVSQALEQAHERGILHRDVKPGNVMVTPSGVCKLMDLGLSRPPEELKEYDSVALEHRSMFGTIGFASPEQASLAETVDARSDIYNLGSTLFYALTGKVHVQGETTQQRLRNLTVDRKFRDPRDFQISDELVNILNGMLALDPSERYQSIAQVTQDLRDLLARRGQRLCERTVSVLVVEDNMPEFLVTESLLSRSNRSLKLSRVERWAEAVQWIDQHDESLIVLLDLNLPDSFSEETIKRIPDIVSDRVGVIALTGDSGPESEKMCFAAGATGFIRKRGATSRSLEREIIAAHSRLSRRAATN